MERNEYIKHINERYKNLLLYSELNEAMNSIKELYKTAPIEGNNL